MPWVGSGVSALRGGVWNGRGQARWSFITVFLGSTFRVKIVCNVYQAAILGAVCGLPGGVCECTRDTAFVYPVDSCLQTGTIFSFRCKAQGLGSPTDSLIPKTLVGAALTLPEQPVQSGGDFTGSRSSLSAHRPNKASAHLGISLSGHTYLI